VKEFRLEWRQKLAFNSILLYIGSTVFVCYMSFGVKAEKISPYTWNVLFWIIMLFVAVNAVAKSFIQERQGRQLYYYSIASPQAIILSKIIYNFLLMFVFSLVAFIFYSLVLGNPVNDVSFFLLAVFLGATGFACSLTLISAITSKASANSSLMAVLSFPVLLPMLLMLIRISKNAVDGLNRSVSYDEIVILVSVNVMLGAISYILFPYLWRS
jgi:heme exporter protein B